MLRPRRYLRSALHVACALAVVSGWGLLAWILSAVPFFAGGATLSLALALATATAAAPLVVVGRLVARARLRATGVDPLARLRRWALARPRISVALLSAPALLAAAFSFHTVPIWAWGNFRSAWPVAWIASLWVVPVVASVVIARAALRRLLLPLGDDAERAAAGAAGFSFSAVAVTPRTRAAVGGLIGVCATWVLLLGALPHQILFDPRFTAALLAYLAGLAGATLAFQRASRIAVGVDGVLVIGTSRSRFFAYRDLDGADVTRGGDILLRRHGRVVLRLQLHGEDQGKHDVIAARIREGVARAAEPGGGGAHRLAEATTAAPLARAARGQGDYRAPGATREALWELVEAPATGGAARAAAGEALAIDADEADRARLRIAAERCAEPSTRAALTRIAVDVELEDDEADALAVPRARRMDAGQPERLR